MRIPFPAVLLALCPLGIAAVYFGSSSTMDPADIGLGHELGLQARGASVPFTSEEQSAPLSILGGVPRSNPSAVQAQESTGTLTASIEVSSPLPLTLDMLSLPVEPLLEPEATAEQYRVWYESSSIDHLVRNQVNLRGLQSYSNTHKDQSPEEFNVSPLARHMLKSSPAISAEIRWLNKRLQEIQKSPFTGPLPVRSNEYHLDFYRQFLFHDIQSLKRAKFEVDHAFTYEKERLTNARFESGLYKSEFITRFG